jgi:hypothetical protein
MMWHWPLRAVVAAMLVASAAFGGEIKIQVSSFPPGQELRPGVAVLLSVSGAEPDSALLVWHPPEIEGDVFLKVGEQYLFAGITAGPRTIIVQVATKGLDPFATITFNYGEQDSDPPPPPPPGKVSGVLILEEQAERTTAQGKIMDDPTWREAAKAKGLTWLILDDDNPAPEAAAARTATAESKLEVPVVCLIDGDGAVIEVRPLPESVEAMRELIGGLK